jgi:hypothetical protein
MNPDASAFVPSNYSMQVRNDVILFNCELIKF